MSENKYLIKQKPLPEYELTEQERLMIAEAENNLADIGELRELPTTITGLRVMPYVKRTLDGVFVDRMYDDVDKQVQEAMNDTKSLEWLEKYQAVINGVSTALLLGMVEIDGAKSETSKGFAIKPRLDDVRRLHEALFDESVSDGQEYMVEFLDGSTAKLKDLTYAIHKIGSGTIGDQDTFDILFKRSRLTKKFSWKSPEALVAVGNVMVRMGIESAKLSSVHMKHDN